MPINCHGPPGSRGREERRSGKIMARRRLDFSIELTSFYGEKCRLLQTYPPGTAAFCTQAL